MIANSLGGSDVELRNFLPLHSCVNQGPMKVIEDQVRKSIWEGETIYYRVVPIYHGTNPVPAAIHIVAVGDQGTDINKPLPNTASC